MLESNNYSSVPESINTSTTTLFSPTVYASTTSIHTSLVDRNTDLSTEQAMMRSTAPFPSPSLPTPSAILESSTDDEMRESGFLLLSKEGLVALYAAGVVCILLTVIVIVLVTVILVMCRRHSNIKRGNAAKIKSPAHCLISRAGLPYPNRVGHYISQLSFSGM